MRSALICVFLTLLVQREGSRAATEDNFRPTPIPLAWQHVKREVGAGTLHETIQTAAPSTVATLPAHYWEDALRHSVYLTLVRDKIDQLIAKSESTSPNSKGYVSKEVDDHDLWDKIKSAPFDRIESEESVALGDVTIMAKGKLMEDAGSYRFTENDKSNEKCSDEKCKEGVKAIWSVKRVRHRDVEPSPGRYHYELTFSVIAQSPKKEWKPYENPVRTFTVQETSPEKIIDTPQESRYYQPIKAQTQRPEKAIWFHKNISHKPRYSGRQYNYNLDRIFTSFFSEEDYEPQPKPKYLQPVYPQYSKVGYVGASSEHYNQKKLIPYPYKPHSYKYSRPPLPPPPPHVLHHYLDIDAIGVVSNPYVSQSNNDHRHGPPHKDKTPRPQFLPTPITTIEPLLNLSIESSYKWNPNITESTTKPTEVISGFNPYGISKPVKFNYFPDHVRPPVYNAPPGVFVTMDKKPFKPMPPLRLVQTSKPSKIIKPTDFRPSPQLLDIQFSEPDPFIDTVFRPITVNYVENNTTEKIETADTISHDDTKPNISNRKKPPKKHENIKTHRLTTNIPEVMTTQTDSEEERDTMQWANILGAFTRTTPMVSQKAKVTESTTSSSTSTTVATTTARKRTTTTTKAPESKTITTTTTTTTTTPKPKKRTRPPPKFTKPEKIKKHQRITSTTTTAPQKKVEQDLTPQASSAATSTTKPWPYPWNKAESTTINKPSTTTKPSTNSTTSTSLPVTSTTQITTTTQLLNIKTTVKPKQTGSENRYRQSALMQKGTSIKHDKWSAANQQNFPQKTTSPHSGPLQGRRKASNFQGYVMTSTPTHSDIKEEQHHHKDHEFSESVSEISSTTEYTTVQSASSSELTQQTYEDIAERYENNAESELEYSQKNEEDSEFDAEENKEHDVQESRDHTEYILQSTVPSEETDNEIIEIEEQATTEKVTLPPKRKCNKMKHLTTTTKLPNEDEDEYENDDIEVSTTTSSTTTTTEKYVTPDIFDELFGGFTFDDADDKPKESQTTSKPLLEEQETTNNEQYLKIDEEFNDFLDGIKGNNKETYSENSDEEYEDDTSIDDDEMYDEDNTKDTVARENTSNDYPEREHPPSLFELIAMQ